jgi:hypothetical protein
MNKTDVMQQTYLEFVVDFLRICCNRLCCNSRQEPKIIFLTTTAKISTHFIERDVIR